MTTHLGIDRVDGLHEHLIDQYRIVGETADLRVAPGLADCLQRLHEASLRLGIVCDVGLISSPTLRARLEGIGLLGRFDAWSFSDETGWFKPAPEAFRPVLDALGVDPADADAAHVGDNERTDVAGAKELGMMAVQYIGLATDPPRYASQRPSPLADHVIDDLAALPDVLGIG